MLDDSSSLRVVLRKLYDDRVAFENSTQGAPHSEGDVAQHQSTLVCLHSKE